MQLKKASKKTSKAAEQNAAVAPETVQAEKTAKPRAGQTSRAKKSEGIEMTSGRNLHKPAKNAHAEAALHVEVTPVAETHKNVRKNVSQDEIAALAYSYWVERGHAHGHAEQDWLRAERELSGE